MPQQHGVERLDHEQPNIVLLDRHQSAGAHDPPELAKGGREFGIGQVLQGIGAPDRIEVALGVRQGGQRALVGLRAAGKLARGDAVPHDCHIVGGEIERRHATGRANQLGKEGQEPTRAAASVEDVPARLDADRAEHRLPGRAAGLEMDVEEACLRAPLPGGGRKDRGLCLNHLVSLREHEATLGCG
jgi:hypothetical protein